MKMQQVEQFIQNPKKSLIKLALPIVIAMTVQILYNFVDTAFVGRLGAESIAALTLSFPIFFIMMSLAVGLSTGMSSRISRFLGEKNKEGAENTAMHGLYMSLVASALVLILGLIFLKPLLSLFGAQGEVHVLAYGYSSVILVGMIFSFLSFIMHYFLTAQGDMKSPTKAQIGGLILNIVLDPIFIYVLGFGVKGAAYATVISWAFSILLYRYYIQKKTIIDLKIAAFKYSNAITKQIIAVAFPASMTMIFMSIYIVFLNRVMAHFGTDYIAAFGLVFRLESVAIMPIVALGTALMTLVGMFYGAKRFDLLKELIQYGLKIAVIFNILIGAIFFIFPIFLLKLFTSDVTLLTIGARYLRIEVFILPLGAVSMLVSRALQGMGFGLPGLIINLVRSLLIAVPLAYFFVFVLGWSYLSVL